MSFEAQLKTTYALARDRLIYPLGKPKPTPVSPPAKVKKPRRITQLSPISTARPTMAYLLRWVSETERISIIDLQGPLHHKEICAARFIFCYLARHYTGASMPMIGRFLGGRDHTTIISAVSRIKVLRMVNEDLCQRVAYYETILDAEYVNKVEEGIKCPHCLRYFKLA